MSDSELVFNPTPGIRYKHRYKDIFKDIAKGNLDKHKTLRTLILTDLWFVVYFVLGMPNANHQFVVNCCREVEDGPKDMTLDIWAREHLKSSIITRAETIQLVLKYPEKTHCIFSYVKPVAKRFLFSIREVFIRNKALVRLFPDVLYENPEKESPLWSADEGISCKTQDEQTGAYNMCIRSNRRYGYRNAL